MRSHSRACATLFVLLGACGPDSIERARLDDVCGQESPYRLLELSEDEDLISTYWGLQRIGDRIYHIVGPAVDLDDAQQEEADFWPTPLPEHTTLLSTGPCGESPKTLAQDIWQVFEDERWPGVVLGRTGITTGDIFVIDPEGVEAPRPFILDVDILDEWTDHGIVSVTPRREWGVAGAARLHPYPATPEDAALEPIVLLEDVMSDYRSVVVRGDELFARLTTNELVRLDLIDGTVTSVQSDVQSFDLSEDGSKLVWQSLPEDGDYENPLPTYFLDRTSGTQTWLADSRVPGFYWPDDGSISISTDPATGFGQRIVMLPSLTKYDVPSSIFVSFDVGAGRWFGWRGAWELLLYDLKSGAEVFLFDGGPAWRAGPDEVEVLDVALRDDPQYLRDQGRLWRVAYDGSDPELVARRATMGRIEVADGRVLTPVDVGNDYLGDLVVVDPDSLEEQLVDDHVFAHLPTQNHDPVFDDDAVAYAVRDGERSGVWLARLAAPE